MVLNTVLRFENMWLV